MSLSHGISLALLASLAIVFLLWYARFGCSAVADGDLAATEPTEVLDLDAPRTWSDALLVPSLVLAAAVGFFLYEYWL